MLIILETGRAVIDQILYLQPYKEGWNNGKWEEKIDERECIEPPAYRPDQDGAYRGWFWGHSDTYAKAFTCLSVQGMARILAPILLKNYTARYVSLPRATGLQFFKILTLVILSSRPHPKKHKRQHCST